MLGGLKLENNVTGTSAYLKNLNELKKVRNYLNRDHMKKFFNILKETRQMDKDLQKDLSHVLNDCYKAFAGAVEPVKKYNAVDANNNNILDEKKKLHQNYNIKRDKLIEANKEINKLKKEIEELNKLKYENGIMRQRLEKFKTCVEKAFGPNSYKTVEYYIKRL